MYYLYSIEYGRQVKHTFLDGLFGGHLVSTVKCEECKNVSAFYSLFNSLPPQSHVLRHCVFLKEIRAIVNDVFFIIKFGLC